MPYAVIFFTLIVASMVERQMSQTPRKLLFFTLLGVVYIFAAFRFEIGCDWESYETHFETLGGRDSSSVTSYREPLWALIIYFLDWSGFSHLSLNLLSVSIFFGGIFSWLKRQTNWITYLMFLFPVLIINMPMSGIRQAAAIGLICVAFGAFVDRRIIKFASFVVISAMIHNSAIFFIIFAPLMYGRNFKSKIPVVIAVGIALVVFAPVGEIIDTVNVRYLGRETEADGALFRLFPHLLAGLLYLFVLRKPWSERFPHEAILMGIGAVSMTLIFALAPLSSVNADRLGYYFIPLQAAIFTRTAIFDLRYGKFLSMLPYFTLVVLFLAWTTLSPKFTYCYLPYKTWILGVP